MSLASVPTWSGGWQNDCTSFSGEWPVVGCLSDRHFQWEMGQRSQQSAAPHRCFAPQNIVVPCRSLPKKDNINCDGDVKFVIPNPPTAIDVSQWGHKFVVYPWCLGQVDAALGASVAQREGRGYSKNIIHLYYGDGRTPISLYHLLLEGRNMDEHQCSVLFSSVAPRQTNAVLSLKLSFKKAVPQIKYDHTFKYGF